ncbi:hypothetical protein KR009_011029 [Drosophila setifemur]|nr:hypothetical protein KR009_011029 [Drosophila setifemur]
MKTLVLSPDDLQNFNKFIYDPKSAAQLAASAGAIGAAAAAAAAVHGAPPNTATTTTVQLLQSGGAPQVMNPGVVPVSVPVSVGVPTSTASNANNLMALHYYLKHPGMQQVTIPQQQQQHHQQQLLAQSQTQLKQLQLKQPTIHQHQQHISYHHHHPYYQQQQAPPPQPQPLKSQQQAHLPVHALNQNSNFSAASSSTGGTASSHAPTQQSNGSSVSPTIVSRVAAVGAPSSSNIAAAANALLRASAATTTSSSSSSSSSSASSSSSSSSSSSASSSSSSANCAKKLKTEPVLSQYNQTERLNFANTYIVWSEEHWRRVVFHDERRFNLDGPDGFSYYFHDLRNYERTLSQRPRGNSVYIYLMVCVGGALHLEVSSAKQRPESCIEAIMRERPNIVGKLGGPEFVLQDHNWMSHALPTVQDLLNAEGLKTQKWPTIAHDLNIMENVWGWLIREVFDGGRKFSRKDDLIFRIKEAWSRLPLDLITNLYSTLPERITELYYTQGVYTNC